MAKGIIYVMETVVPGLIKIGKTGTENFESRMYQLERNGYNNVVGLKRRFAIEVDAYDEKEALIDSLFDRSRLQNSELFALDVELVIQLLSSFDGKQVYPKNETKEESFREATQNRQEAAERGIIPDGTYHLDENIRGFGRITATMRVEHGMFIVEKGAVCRPAKASWIPAALRDAPIRDNVLLEDVECNSPSTAAWIPTGRASNGWIIWKCEDGRPINILGKRRLNKPLNTGVLGFHSHRSISTVLRDQRGVPRPIKTTTVIPQLLWKCRLVVDVAVNNS